MAYTGHRRQWLNIQRAGMAWSDDLDTWHKCEGNPVTEACGPWYHLGERDPETRLHCAWRDPFLTHDGDSWYQLLTAEAAGGNNRNEGVIARARSHDLMHWVLVEPLDAPSMGEMECPQIHQIDGRWYLIFSTGGGMAGMALRAACSDQDLHRGVFSMVADEQWGPYRLYGDGRIQVAEREPQLYAGQLVKWQGKNWLLGFSFSAEGPSECIHDPIALQATPAGLQERR